MADLGIGVGRFMPVPEITLDDMDYPRGVDPNGISIQEIGRYIGRAFAPDDLQVDILEQKAYGEADSAYSKLNIDIYSQQVLSKFKLN